MPQTPAEIRKTLEHWFSDTEKGDPRFARPRLVLIYEWKPEPRYRAGHLATHTQASRWRAGAPVPAIALFPPYGLIFPIASCTTLEEASQWLIGTP